MPPKGWEAVTREKPLHSLFGEYVECLRDGGFTESEMALRILKSSISTLVAFNDVRNNRSLAHDNPVLHYDEALLIFNHIASSVRFLRSLEDRLKRTPQNVSAADEVDDLSFSEESALAPAPPAILKPWVCSPFIRHSV